MASKGKLDDEVSTLFRGVSRFFFFFFFLLPFLYLPRGEQRPTETRVWTREASRRRAARVPPISVGSIAERRARREFSRVGR